MVLNLILDVFVTETLFQSKIREMFLLAGIIQTIGGCVW